MSRDNETFIYYHVGIPRDSTLLEQLKSDAKTRGMLREVPKLIAVRLGDWYAQENRPVMASTPIALASVPTIVESLSIPESAADNANAALDEWG